MCIQYCQYVTNYLLSTLLERDKLLCFKSDYNMATEYFIRAVFVICVVGAEHAPVEEVERSSTIVAESPDT